MTVADIVFEALARLEMLAVGEAVPVELFVAVGLIVGVLVPVTDDVEVLVGVTLGHLWQIRFPSPFGPHGHLVQQSAKSSHGPPSNCMGMHVPLTQVLAPGAG